MVSFAKLWANHPGVNSSPCEFANQCAIRMGVALHKSGVSLSSFRGARCWHGHNPKHILRAQELANWIKENPRNFGTRTVHRKVTYSNFSGKRGIVFIKDGWGATDHIDIWDGATMKGGFTDYFAKGKEVWFWKLG